MNVHQPREIPTTSIVALGSPHGDDRVGWDVAQQLRSRLSSQISRLVRIELVTSPWDIVSPVEPTTRMILIDACQSGAVVGTIHQWQPHHLDQLTNVAPRWASSHGGSLPQAIEMASRLGRLPDKMTIVAIEGERFAPGDLLSPLVQQAIPLAVQRVLAILADEWPPCTNTLSSDRC